MACSSCETIRWSSWSFYLAAHHGNRLLKEASGAWKALSDEGKAEYVAKAAADKARYESERNLCPYPHAKDRLTQATAPPSGDINGIRACPCA